MQGTEPWGKPQSRSGRAVEDTAKPWGPNGARLRGSGEGGGTSELSARRALSSRGPECEHAAGAERPGGTRGTGETGNRATYQGTRRTRGRSLGRRCTEGVLRRREAGPGLDPKSEPQRNTAARRRAEPVGPDRRTIGTCARCWGREDTGSDPLDT
ncbi:hypothetical protein NDU88_000115 [Pleurodeles waltl]|uniref:Uncharacterized protein n=1 Tax=Pleurodeles waltl TaxID=8319 RepID=A0AAV7KN78_PLEWA|nr:hypothetical protein NDU88_000115 [Pleurodeles waltl]